MTHEHEKHECCHDIQPRPPRLGDSALSLGKGGEGEKESVFYSCPMHPEVQSDKSGLCSECGMNLIKSAKSKKQNDGHGEHAGHFDKHAGHSTNIFKVKFWASLVLTIPTFLYSDMAEKLGLAGPEFLGATFLGPVLGSVVFFYGGWVFLIGAYRELRARLPGMMTLIALAVVTAYAYSLYITLRGGGETLFFELSSLVTVMLLGHWIEMRAVSGAQGALRELSKLLPDKAILIIRKSQFPISKSKTNSNTQISDADPETREVALEELKVRDWVLVKPGAKVPADGVIVEGQSEFNEALLTGESKPVSKKE